MAVAQSYWEICQETILGPILFLIYLMMTFIKRSQWQGSVPDSWMTDSVLQRDWDRLAVWESRRDMVQNLRVPSCKGDNL